MGLQKLAVEGQAHRGRGAGSSGIREEEGGESDTRQEETGLQEGKEPRKQKRGRDRRQIPGRDSQAPPRKIMPVRGRLAPWGWAVKGPSLVFWDQMLGKIVDS